MRSVPDLQYPPLSARELHFGYGKEEVLGGLDLELRPAEIFVLLGGNGAGKSTLIQLALGLRLPWAGEVRVLGVDPGRDPVEARNLVTYIPENVVVYEQLSGLENLAYFLRLAQHGRPTEAELEGWLEESGLPESAWRRRCGTYSKGMRQKLILTLALARQARLLLLDEPTSGLDPKGIEDFHDMLLVMKARGVSTLLVTHDLLGASAVADRLGFLTGGVISRQIDARGSQRFDLSELRGLYLGYSGPARFEEPVRWMQGL